MGGIEFFQRGEGEEAILSDELSIEPHFPAAEFRALDADEVPMDAAGVSIARGFVGLTGGEVERARDFFVEQDIAHRLEDVRVEAEREFADVARAGVAVQHAVQRGGVVGGGALDAAFGEFQPHIVEGVALINAGDVEGHMALDAFFHRAGKHFAVGDVAVAAASHGADVFDGKSEVGAGALDVDLVGAVHQGFERGHARGHAAVVECANVEVKILERRGAHLRLLGHGGRGPAEDDPFGLVDAPVHDGPHFPGDELHFFIRHIAHLGDVVAAPHGDVGLHFFHAREFQGRGSVEPDGFRAESKLAGQACVVVLDERNRAAIARGADQSHADRIGNIEEIDENFFTGLQFRGVLGENGGQFVAAWIVHGGKKSAGNFFGHFAESARGVGG